MKRLGGGGLKIPGGGGLKRPRPKLSCSSMEEEEEEEEEEDYDVTKYIFFLRPVCDLLLSNSRSSYTGHHLDQTTFGIWKSLKSLSPEVWRPDVGCS
jgi:hypothetical protein